MTREPHDDPHGGERDKSPDIECLPRLRRALMIQDGLLIDLSDWAEPLGITIPVACTVRVWLSWIAPPEGTRVLGQSERVRAHVILRRLARLVAEQPVDPPPQRLSFSVLLQQKAQVDRAADLAVMYSAGDTPEAPPVLTIQMPDEPGTY